MGVTRLSIRCCEKVFQRRSFAIKAHIFPFQLKPQGYLFRFRNGTSTGHLLLYLQAPVFPVSISEANGLDTQSPHTIGQVGEALLASSPSSCLLSSREIHRGIWWWEFICELFHKVCSEVVAPRQKWHQETRGNRPEAKPRIKREAIRRLRICIPRQWDEMRESKAAVRSISGRTLRRFRVLLDTRVSTFDTRMRRDDSKRGFVPWYQTRSFKAITYRALPMR